MFGIFKIGKIFEIFQTGNFLNFPNWKINNVQKCYNLKNIKIPEFFVFGKLSKFQKLTNFGIVRLFDIPRYS